MNNILCIFEGEKTEHRYFKKLESSFFSDEAIIKCSYGNDIYHLFQELKADNDLDIVELIRESKKVPNNAKILDGLEREDISQVYLFFDMEPHDEGFSFNKLEQMLNLFNEETELGKLYISYPMVEALRDVPSLDTFDKHSILITEVNSYKEVSSHRANFIPLDYRKITAYQWVQLALASDKKARFLCRSIGQQEGSEQNQILPAQLFHYEQNSKIYILSAFPLFLFEYYPKSYLESRSEK